MKYEWSKVKYIGLHGTPDDLLCLNDPLGVHTRRMGEPERRHDGLNLTSDGEWIPAPGFPQPPPNLLLHGGWLGHMLAKSDEEYIERLKAKIVELEGDGERLHEELATAKDRIDELEENAKLMISENGALQSERDSLLAMARNDKSSFIAERERAHHERLCAIEQWATQPCKDPMLRSAQAHVLKMARGEA